MLLKLFVIASVLVATKCQTPYFRDYYWRHYTDTIPSDAYQGGSNENGTTYIGQVLALDLSPVEIRPGHRDVYIPELHPQARRSLVKILCSNNVDKLRWYSTNSNDFTRLLNEKTVLRGGFNAYDDPFFIGRVFYRNQLIVGRIEINYGDPFLETLYWSGGGYAYHISTTFDALVYEDPIYIKDRTT